jgi:hypothetical protein
MALIMIKVKHWNFPPFKTAITYKVMIGISQPLKGKRPARCVHPTIPIGE